MFHEYEAEILHFEYTNFDGGVQYLNDKDTAFFPFTNTSAHDITLLNIVSKNKYLQCPYELISPNRKTTYKNQQRDTIFFKRVYRSELKEGHYDQSCELSFEGIENKQYLNIFCDLKNNQGKLVSEYVALPTVKRGEKIVFASTVKNEGKTTVKIYPLTDWNDPALKSLDAYPISIKPGDSCKLNFELKTDRLFNFYSRQAYFSSNADDQNRMVISYSGELISENYPSILFDSTSLKLDTYKGGPGEFHFWFTNDGNEPLIITMVKTSCGCLVPYYPKEPIMPGERNEIKIKYDTYRVGPINKTATVQTNVSDHPITLRVLGSVREVE